MKAQCTLVKLKPGVYTHVNKCRKWLPENMNKTRGEIDKAKDDA